MSVFRLNRLVDELSAGQKQLFERIYKVRNLRGRLELPEGCRRWAGEQFGSTAAVEYQSIVKISNMVTGEDALFNYLRGRRPMSASPAGELDAAVEEQRQGCRFCDPERYAPRDLFGRVRGKYCLTASNVAKYDAFHGLVISGEHHPLRFNEMMAEDYFRAAAEWFGRAARHATVKEPETALYPLLLWNCLWPAGASIVHGHLQLAMTTGRHYARVERLRRQALEYSRGHGSSYFGDLFELHGSLGLGWTSGKCRHMAALTPIKERELWLSMDPGPVCPDSLAYMGRMVGRVLVRLRERVKLSSFNVVLYLPPLRPVEENWDEFPLLARLVDRGDALNRVADFGAMELFAASVIGTDPFELPRLLN